MKNALACLLYAGLIYEFGLLACLKWLVIGLLLLFAACAVADSLGYRA